MRPTAVAVLCVASILVSTAGWCKTSSAKPSFHPDRAADAETKMWKAYYSLDNKVLVGQLRTLAQEQHGVTARQAKDIAEAHAGGQRMAYDEGLAFRIEEALAEVQDVEQKKMFGGLAFMVRQHMCVGVIDEKLMARVGPDRYAECLAQEHACEMTFTGKPLKGLLYIEPEGISTDEQLNHWIQQCLEFVANLPDK